MLQKPVINKDGEDNKEFTIKKEKQQKLREIIPVRSTDWNRFVQKRKKKKKMQISVNVCVETKWLIRETDLFG